MAKTEPNNGKTDGQSAQEAEFRVVSVKLRPAELAELDAVCAELGVKRNRLLRTLARKAAGFLEPDEAVASALKQTTRQIGGIANNINQIAKVGNSTGRPDYLEFLEERRALGAQLGVVESLTRTILNIGKRRADGFKRLKEVLDDG